MDNYIPPTLLRNPHVQSILASTGPRKLIVRRRAKKLVSNATAHILDCGSGIRLQGEYSHNPDNNKGLVILIHGWLGGNDSMYLLSSANALFLDGFNVFRLNLRDHGNSGHLNKGLFNSTRLDEVVNAVYQIQQLFPHQYNYLSGFSLGGNFALRIATKAPEKNISLDKVVSICPVINPGKTNVNIQQGLFIYHYYFQKKWKRSLLNKLDHFPEYGYREKLKEFKTLDEMNQYFVPNHTDFDSTDDYLKGYSIDGDYLSELTVPCHIISSIDDPVIEAKDLQQLAESPQLTVELTRYGGHCGYIDSFKLTSWIDSRLKELLSPPSN
jgi:predicted alpha/beta-fold hydrolase